MVENWELYTSISSQGKVSVEDPLPESSQQCVMYDSILFLHPDVDLQLSKHRALHTLSSGTQRSVLTCV